jgi:hypothetical protein
MRVSGNGMRQHGIKEGDLMRPLLRQGEQWLLEPVRPGEAAIPLDLEVLDRSGLFGVVVHAVGVYRIQPAQADRPVTTVSLMSNGLAFNAINPQAGGTWRLDKSEVEITWSSGWLTRFEPKVQGLMQVRIWEPGRRPPSSPTAIRPGLRLEAAAP